MRFNNNSGSDDEFDDINTDEENTHDQLPSPDEYRAGMDDSAYNSSRNMEDSYDGEDDHDLPTVDQYKTNMSFRENEDERPKSRAGLYTFLCLVLLLIIITAIAVPLALKNKGGGNSPDQSNTSGGGFTGSNPGERLTGSPVNSPTRPPTRPPSTSDLPRKDRTFKYLNDFGLADYSVLNNPSTPEAKAANWIANEDSFNLEIPQGGTMNRFSERWALAVIYFSTGGDGWRYKLNFLQPIDHCDWYDRFVDPNGYIIRQGVTECQRFDQGGDEMVTKLEISNNMLNGQVPSTIKYLRNLYTWITPFNTDLKTTLDAFLVVPSLSHLELQYCGVSGMIPPGIDAMQRLTFLGLGNNLLEGPIPDSFFKLTNLKVLGLDDNLLESPISKFASLNQMQKLYLEDNMINGELTDDLIREGWQSMVDLDISANRLEGPLPSMIWSMPLLEVVDIHGNDFNGQIPEVVGVARNLVYVGVQDNSLDGTIPESISNMEKLRHLDVSANNLVLPFPQSMELMTTLEALYTGINGFVAHPVPAWLSVMTNLKELSMKQNQLTGAIPGFLGNLLNLQVLDLDFNKLNGAIPAELGRLTLLDTLMLNRNFLDGTIPDSFAGLTDIDVLLLDGNSITGTADIICGTPTINTTAFSADCGDSEISCSCCTICCSDSDPDCNNLDWRINLDGIWEYDFQRVVYSFTQEVLPASAKSDYANGP